MPSSQDRFIEVTSPAAPGQCKICGIPFGKRRLFDTGLNADFCIRHPADEIRQDDQGAVYFCEQCVIALGQVAGLISKDKAGELYDRVAELEEIAGSRQVRILGLESILDAYGIPSSVEFSPALSDSVGLTDEIQVTKISGATSITGTGGSISAETSSVGTSGNQEINEPSDSVRSNVISSDSEPKSGSGGDSLSADELGL